MILVSTLVGSGGAFGLWKLFTGDFLNPYRIDQKDLRERVEKAELRADEAHEIASQARAETAACREREAALRLVLIGAGLPIPPSLED